VRLRRPSLAGSVRLGTNVIESYARAKEALFDYIEVFYNQRRRHSTLGQISPAAFERGAERGFPQRPYTSSLYEEERRPKRPTLINLSTDPDQVQNAESVSVGVL
jgi:hypothetical protein